MSARAAIPVRRQCMFVGVCVVAALLLISAMAQEPTEVQPTWSADPAQPGTGLPPVGRSLFDYEFTEVVEGRRVYALPFPFSALLEKLNTRTGGNVRAVLIPLGRSLQRSAANPDFFEFPRVVAAVVDEPPAAYATLSTPLKDRLFLGYQERAEIIEVISYNEAAGRFEFQVVRNYRAGAEPDVRYAERNVCIPCHQNHAPIFSRPLWDETNANADVAARLLSFKNEFHGIGANVGVDVPDAIDAATDRANRLAAYQRIWVDGCGRSNSISAVTCRADLLVATLRYRLAGQRHWRAADSERTSIANALVLQWPGVWAGGLAIPDPDIPNRKFSLFESGRGPLDLPGALQHGAPLSVQDTVDLAKVPENLEPINARQPLEIWRAADVETRLDDIVAGLASFMSPRDIADLDQLLVVQRRVRPPQILHASCALTGNSSSGGGVGMDHGRFQLACADPGNELALRLDASISLAAEPAADGSIGHGTLHRMLVPDSVPLRGRTLSVTRELGNAGRLQLHPDAGPGGFRTTAGNTINSVTLALSEPGIAGAATLEVELLADFAAITDAVTVLAARTIDGESQVLSGLPFHRTAVLSKLFELLGGTYSAECCGPDTPMPPAVLQGSLP